MAKEPKREIKNPQVDPDYVALFLRSPLGPKVLGKMIDSVDLLNIAQDTEFQGAQNEIKIILSHCGIGYGLSGQQYVKALMGKNAVNVLSTDEVIDGDE